MGTILQVTYGNGDLLDRMFALQLSALRNHDMPALWRLTDELIEIALQSAVADHQRHWPTGYISENRFFGVPVDPVADLPHLLCENYMLYPYISGPNHVFVQ